MKKLLCALLAAVMVLSLCACAKGQGEATPTGGENTTPSQTQGETTVPETTVAETTVPHEHEYKEKVTKDATCDAKGEKTFTCDCGDSYTEEIKKLDHDYSKATCKKPKTCKNCGKTSGDKASHKYSSGKCTVCGKFQSVANTKWRAYVVCSQNEMDEMVFSFTKSGGGFDVAIYAPASMMEGAKSVEVDGKKWYQEGFGYGSDEMSYQEKDNTVTVEIDGRGAQGTVVLERTAGNKLKVKSVKGTIIDEWITEDIQGVVFKLVG